MFRRVLSTVAIGCSISAAVAVAQMEPPAPTMAPPATAPSTMPLGPADATTPTGTLRLLSRATQSGDSASVKDLFFSNGPQEKKLADMLIERTEVYAKFRQAAAKAFGEQAATDLTGISAADADAVEQKIGEATVTIKDNTASVQMKPEAPGTPAPEPVELTKVDGKWKLSMNVLTAGLEPAEIDERLKKIKLMSDVVSEATKEISAGKYKSAEEVNDAMRGKLASVLLDQAAASTQPTTAAAPGSGGGEQPQMPAPQNSAPQPQ